MLLAQTFTEAGDNQTAWENIQKAWLVALEALSLRAETVPDESPTQNGDFRDGAIEVEI